MFVTEESHRSRATRINILLYLSAFVAFLGVPLFFHTTSIHRADLPAEDVQRRSHDFLDNTRVKIPVFVDPSTAFPGLLETSQSIIDASLIEQNLAGAWSLFLLAGDGKGFADSAEYVVRLKQSGSDPSSQQQFSYELSPTLKEITVYYPLESTSMEDLAAYVSQLLLETVFKSEIEALATLSRDSSTADVVFPYSPKYNVIFNLFVEDGRPVNWPIEDAVDFIQPVFSALGDFSTFKISSQIHYYSKLQSEPQLNSDGTARVLSQHDLATFINYNEWNLNSHDIAPSINFLVFFPSSTYEKRPLLVENSKTNSFLIPQWGGVHIFNGESVNDETKPFEIAASDLHVIFDNFASQLFELLGVPSTPQSAIFRVAAFHRIATLKNLKRALSNLTALLKISSSLNGISIPESTRAHVLAALDNYDQAIERLQKNDFESAVTFSGRSVENSDKAFFEKEMVQQAYFPSEHKLAVFSPLLGPICSIVFFGLLKYLRSRRSGESGSNELRKKNL